MTKEFMAIGVNTHNWYVLQRNPEIYLDINNNWVKWDGNILNFRRNSRRQAIKDLKNVVKNLRKKTEDFDKSTIIFEQTDP